ncbi:hypothetical protein MNBD_ALPHA12-359 [hydrothermal vent metagenome]|uniref:Uncharacterized protein n=1 Tax=hydrothermal vent metagenome TaxID=652676 RepID=A0A3B0U7C8_9ZZZZ
MNVSTLRVTRKNELCPFKAFSSDYGGQVSWLAMSFAASFRLPGLLSQWHVKKKLIAHSCGGSHGFGP